MIFQVVVIGLQAKRYTIDLCNTNEQMQSMTVKQLKIKVSAILPPNTELDQISMIFADKRLDKESKPLVDYGIQHMSTIHAVIKMAGGMTL